MSTDTPNAVAPSEIIPPAKAEKRVAHGLPNALVILDPDITLPADDAVVEKTVGVRIPHPTPLAPGAMAQLAARIDATGAVTDVTPSDPGLLVQQLVAGAAPIARTAEGETWAARLAKHPVRVAAGKGWFILSVINKGEAAVEEPSVVLTVTLSPGTERTPHVARAARPTEPPTSIDPGTTTKVLIGRSLAPDILALLDRGAGIDARKRPAIAQYLEGSLRRPYALDVGSHGQEIVFEMGRGHLEELLRAARSGGRISDRFEEVDRRAASDAVRAVLEPGRKAASALPSSETTDAEKALVLLRSKGLCGRVRRKNGRGMACILAIGHDDGKHEERKT